MLDDQPGPGIYRAPSEFGYYDRIGKENNSSQ